MTSSDPLLSLRLCVDYPNKPGVLRDVALEVARGEVVGLVGQSGSGKSTLALAILELLRLKGGVATGELRFEGQDLMAFSERQMRGLRGSRIGLVLQSPLSALNPALRIGGQMKEAWRAHRNGQQEDCTRSILSALRSVSLEDGEALLSRFPSQLSVGQAQRVLIAMAILHRPPLVIADEPTSALDPITQSEIMQLFAGLNRKLGTAILYISHDLLAVASLCERVVILHEGCVVESGKIRQIFKNPSHPYTRRLIAALPMQPFGSPEDHSADSENQDGATSAPFSPPLPPASRRTS